MTASQDNTALAFMKQENMSKFKEQFAEYYFLKDILLEAASNNIIIVVSRSDYDAFGFDLLISKQNENNWNNIKLQLKATAGKATNWDVHKSLLNDEEGQIIVIKLFSDLDNIRPEYWLFDKNQKNNALKTLPRIIRGKINPKKCKITTNKKAKQFINITNSLLSIFDKQTHPQ